jgi:hypothetical protein
VSNLHFISAGAIVLRVLGVTAVLVNGSLAADVGVDVVGGGMRVVGRTKKSSGGSDPVNCILSMAFAFAFGFVDVDVDVEGIRLLGGGFNNDDAEPVGN